MFFRKFGRVARRVGLVAVVALTMLGVLLPGVAQAAPAAGTVERPAYSGYYYTVRPGDTLSGIARYNGTTVQAIMSANGLYSTVIFVGQVLYIPAGGGGGGGGGGYCAQTYVVRPGDTLSGIARWYGVSTSALAQANGIWNYNHVYVGQRLCIPSGYGPPPPPPGPKPPPRPVPPPWGACGQYYYVQQGDNLSRIAARCGTTTQSLVYLNGISHPSLIYPGQCLRMY